MGLASNLKPFKKGQSGNPNGRPALPIELRQARREKMISLIQLVHACVEKTEDQVNDGFLSGSMVQLEGMIQAQIQKAKEGDTNAFKFLIEIMGGKIPEADDIQNSISDLTTEEKLAALKQAVVHLEAQQKIEEKDAASF